MQRDMLKSERSVRTRPLAGENGIERWLARIPEAVHAALTHGELPRKIEGAPTFEKVEP
jgi:hypothetical protein